MAISRDGTGALPPGPTLPVAAQALSWTFRPGPFLDRCQRRYGDLFTVRLEMGGAPRVLIADPAMAAALLARTELMRVPATRAAIRPVFGEDAVVMTEGAKHRRRRQVMSPAFRGRHLDRYRELILDAADREIDDWPLGSPFAVRPRLQAMTLEVILDVVFGRRDPGRREEIGHQIDRLLAAIGNRGAGFGIALPSRVRELAAARLGRWRASFDALVEEEIEARRHDSPGELDDALAHLVATGADGGEALSDKSICDQVCTLLLAGHETTATSLAWAVEHLVNQPGGLDRLAAALDDPDGGERYADAVVAETLRLNPPLPNTQRELGGPLELGGYELPEGTLVAPCAYLIHRRPDVYPEPLAFQPERFLDTTPPQEIWWPFGGGSRRCIGASFARLQMSMVLRRLAERTRLRAASPGRREPIRKRGILFAPARGARVVMSERLAARPGRAG
jgi:cytochrome P450